MAPDSDKIPGPSHRPSQFQIAIRRIANGYIISEEVETTAILEHVLNESINPSICRHSVSDNLSCERGRFSHPKRRSLGSFFHVQLLLRVISVVFERNARSRRESMLVKALDDLTPRELSENESTSSISI